MARRSRTRSIPPRHRSAIPRYSRARGPDPALIWIDRLVIRFPGGRIRYSHRDQLEAYLREVGRGRVLRFGGGQRTMMMYVRRGWLFGGELAVRPEHQGRGGEAQLDFKLDLNPTRFAVHNEGPPEAVRSLPARNVLRRDERLRQEAVSLSLDGVDNIIPTRRLGSIRTHYFSSALPIYVHKVCELLEGAFPGAMSGFRTDPQAEIVSVFPVGDRPRTAFRWEGWVVRQVENYWEFGTDDAPLLVSALAGCVEEVAAELEQHHYDVQRSTTGMRSNLRSLSVPLGAQGVRLSAYAKAHDRLRVEVRHYANLRRVYGRRASTTAYPNDNPEQLGRFLEFIGQRAHERATVFLGSLRNQIRTIPPTVTRLSALLAAVSRACRGDADLVRRLLHLLIANRRIVGPGDPETRAVVDALVEAGVLARTRSTLRRTPAVFSVTGGYARTLRALRDMVEREARRSP